MDKAPVTVVKVRVMGQHSLGITLPLGAHPFKAGDHVRLGAQRRRAVTLTRISHVTRKAKRK